MISAVNQIRFFTQDKIMLAIVEALFLIVLLYAWWQEGRRAGAVVTRGEDSWQQFALAYGVFSVILAEVVSASSAYSQHKVTLIVFNLLAALYLCFYNSWARNKIIGLITKSKQKKEF